MHAHEQTPTDLGLYDLEFPSAWARRPSAYAGAAHARTRERALELGLIADRAEVIERFDRQNFALLSAYVYPNADVDRLTACNDFNTYLFFIDDCAEEDETIGKNPDRLRRIMDCHVLGFRHGVLLDPADRLSRLVLDIRERFSQWASDAWMRRLADDVRDYLLLGTFVGARNWAQLRVPSLEEYRTARAFDSAVFPCQDLIEIVENIELPEEVFRHQDIQRLRRLCAQVVAFANDLFSFPKEVRRFDSPNNLLRVVMAEEGLDHDRAVARCIEMINADVREFESIVAGLPSWGTDVDRAVRAYVAGQRSWMRGNFAWSLETGRYAASDHIFPEMRHVPSAANDPAFQRAPWQ
jgi:hypothetical protein